MQKNKVSKQINPSIETNVSGISQETAWKKLSEVEGAFDEVAQFRNDDVPTFLKKLREFQEESSKVRIMVG